MVICVPFKCHNNHKTSTKPRKTPTRKWQEHVFFFFGGGCKQKWDNGWVEEAWECFFFFVSGIASCTSLCLMMLLVITGGWLTLKPGGSRCWGPWSKPLAIGVTGLVVGHGDLWQRRWTGSGRGRQELIGSLTVIERYDQVKGGMIQDSRTARTAVFWPGAERP